MKFVATVLLVLSSVSPIRAQDCAFFCDWEFWYSLDAQSTRDLIAAGADVEERDSGSFSALAAGVALGDVEMVHVLLDAGADVNGAPDDLLKPIHEAAKAYRHMLDTSFPTASEAEYLEIIEVLLAAGADINARDFNNSTPLLIAAGNDVPAIVELLIERGADIEAQNVIGWRPLHNATAELEVSGTVAPLLAAGAEVNVRTIYGETPLHFAASGKSYDEVAMLITAGADVNAADENGATAMMRATLYERDRDNLILLLDVGADVNAINAEGATGLHIAAAENPENVSLLLEAGADGTIKNNDGDTPFDLIKEDAGLKGGAVYLALEAASLE